jgi:hypothetical protein
MAAYLVLLMQDGVVASSGDWLNMDSEEIEDFISQLENSSEVISYQVMEKLSISVR